MFEIVRFRMRTLTHTFTCGCVWYVFVGQPVVHRALAVPEEVLMAQGVEGWLVGG